jgi:hypothetical protein
MSRGVSEYPAAEVVTCLCIFAVAKTVDVVVHHVHEVFTLRGKHLMYAPPITRAWTCMHHVHTRECACLGGYVDLVDSRIEPSKARVDTCRGVGCNSKQNKSDCEVCKVLDIQQI